MHKYIYLHVMHVHSCFCVCNPDKRDYDPQLLMIQWSRPSSIVWYTCIKRIHNDEWSQSTYWVWPRRMYSISFPERIIVMWLSSRIVRFWCSISGMALSERIGSPKSNASCLFLRIQRSVWVHLGSSCPIFSHNHLMSSHSQNASRKISFSPDAKQIVSVGASRPREAEFWQPNLPIWGVPNDLTHIHIRFPRSKLARD